MMLLHVLHLFTSVLILPYNGSLICPKFQTFAQLVNVIQNVTEKHPGACKTGVKLQGQNFPYENKSGEFNFLSLLAESVFTLVQEEDSFKGVSYLTIHTFLINEVQ